MRNLEDDQNGTMIRHSASCCWDVRLVFVDVETRLRLRRFQRSQHKDVNNQAEAEKRMWLGIESREMGRTILRGASPSTPSTLK